MLFSCYDISTSESLTDSVTSESNDLNAFTPQELEDIKKAQLGVCDPSKLIKLLERRWREKYKVAADKVILEEEQDRLAFGKDYVSKNDVYSKYKNKKLTAADIEEAGIEYLLFALSPADYKLFDDSWNSSEDEREERNAKKERDAEAKYNKAYNKNEAWIKKLAPVVAADLLDEKNPTKHQLFIGEGGGMSANTSAEKYISKAEEKVWLAENTSGDLQSCKPLQRQIQRQPDIALTNEQGQCGMENIINNKLLVSNNANKGFSLGGSGLSLGGAGHHSMEGGWMKPPSTTSTTSTRPTMAHRRLRNQTEQEKRDISSAAGPAHNFARSQR